MDQAEITADLLVTGRYLYPQDKDKKIIKNGAVAIRQDTIIDTGIAADLAAKYPRAEVLAADHGLILPGLVNAQPMQP